MDHVHPLGTDWLTALCGTALGNPGLIASLFLAGLAGSISHCAGMCGPFVLTQVTARLGRVPADEFGGWTRLRGAALLPYHLGRLTTYSALGAAAAGLTGAFVRTTEFRWVTALFLLLAAALFLGQIGAGVLPRPPQALRGHLTDRAVAGVSRLARRLFDDPRGWRGYGLGLTLGFLPCGLLYSALAAAASSGRAAVGAAAMAAFVAGTFPTLFAIGYGSTVLGRHWRGALARLAQPMLALNAVLLVALAVRDLL